MELAREANPAPPKVMSSSLDLIVPPTSPIFPPLSDVHGSNSAESTNNAMMPRRNYEVILHSPLTKPESPRALSPLREVSNPDEGFEGLHAELSNPPRTTYEVVLHDPQSRKVSPRTCLDHRTAPHAVEPERRKGLLAAWFYSLGSERAACRWSSGTPSGGWPRSAAPPPLRRATSSALTAKGRRRRRRRRRRR